LHSAFLRCRETEFFYYEIVVNTVSNPSLYKLALFIDCRQRTMPASNHVCRHCGEMVSYNNMARHMSRRHSSQHGRSTPSSSISRSRTPSSDRGSSATREFTSVYAADSVATPDIVREATLCMIRRNDGYNVPSMSQYLQACFPRIPADWHMPMIVAAFTAVQKASAMHGDTQLRDDDQRKEWARRSLARWGHGLGAVEPGRYRTNPQESISRESSVDRDETRNLLETRELPVSGDSRFAQADVERVFQASSVGWNRERSRSRRRIRSRSRSGR